MRKGLAILLTALMMLSGGFSCVCVAEPADADAMWEMVAEAYTYAFPLMLTDATRTHCRPTQTAQ